MDITRLIFWQPMLSPHFFAVFYELKKLNYELIIVVERNLIQSRIDQGWHSPDVGSFNFINLTETKVEKVIKKFNSNSDLHLFSGIYSYKLLRYGMYLCLKNNLNFAIVAEVQDWFGVKGYFRYLLTKLSSLILNKKLKLFLAIGDNAKKWYSKAGIDQRLIYDWGYFIPNHKLTVDDDQIQNSTDSSNSSNVIKFIYVGRLVNEKGILWLLNCFLNYRLMNFELHIVGDGPELENCKNVASLFLNNNILFHGKVPMNEVVKLMLDKDYLILPSLGKDGWGVVVNEAIQCGLKVILSNNVGSSCIIKNSKLGYVFDPLVRNNLSDILTIILYYNKCVTDSERDYIKSFSKKISPSTAAKYMHDVLNYTLNHISERPSAPWLKE